MDSSLKKRLVGFFLLILTLVSLGGSVSSVFAGYSNVEDISEDGWKTIRGAAKKAKELGISAEAFAGMMGNANEESSFDATLEEAGNVASRGLGLFQWTDTSGSPRRTQYENWVKEKGYDISDPATAGAASIEYMDQEMQGNSDFGSAFWSSYIHGIWGRTDLNQTSKSYDEFKKASDVRGATYDFVAAFERPAADTLNKRADMAEAIYKKIKDEYGTTSGDDSSSTDAKKKESVSDNLKRWSEEDIPNMPKDRDYGKEERGFKDRIDKIEKLKGDEATSIAKWKEERDVSIQRRTIKGTRLVVMVLSMIALVYPSFLLFAYVFDSWFVYVDSPAMRLVTFNRRAIEQNRNGSNGLWFADKKENARLKTKRLGLGDTLIWAAIFSIVGVAGVSGLMYETAGSIWQFIADSWGYFLNG
jgi:hypothetical protein